MTSYQRGVYYDVFETLREITQLSGKGCEPCGHDRTANAHVLEDPCDCGCVVDTYILEAVAKARPLAAQPNCGCMCHSFPGVRHVAPCCDAPPVDF